MDKEELLHAIGGKVICATTIESNMGFLKLKMELLYKPAILLLGIYPDKTITQKDTHTMLIATYLQYSRHGNNLNVH